MALRAAFIFLAPGADPARDRTTLSTQQVYLTVVGVPGYDDAERVARSLVQEGVTALELCGGFGNAGAARISGAVAGKAVVGVVRFDGHPGLAGKSGDEVFGGGS